MKKKKVESQIVTRLRLWIQKQGITNTEFCEAIGKSKSYITCMSKAPSPEAFDAIMEKYPSFPRAWVMFGDDHKPESYEYEEPNTCMVCEESSLYNSKKGLEEVEKKLNEQIQETNKWKRIAYHFKAAFEASCGNMDTTIQGIESIV